MKKKIVLFFLFLLTPQLLSSNSHLSNKNICKTNPNIFNINTIKDTRIQNIEIDIQDYRKWTVNGLRVLIGNFRWVSEKYKKRFPANIVVNFDDGLKCKYSAKVRHSGNQKDHVELKENSINQSIDVHLNAGNILGISKFKLLLKHTRGNYVDEIILTKLLREFNYISPRTNFINVTVNGIKTERIFQEKPGQITLKYHLRAEEALFESDERFVFRLAEKLPDNNLSNWSLGMVPLIEDGINSMLARHTNKDFIAKEKNKKSSFETLTNLNYIYLVYSNSYKNKKNNYFYGDYTFDNKLLGFGKSDNIMKLDIYNLLVSAANGHHSLSANNRKFYWNKEMNFFEPVNYDNNANIEFKSLKLIPPFTKKTEEAFDILDRMLKNLDANKFKKELYLSGLDLSEKIIDDKMSTLRSNLKKLRIMYNNYIKNSEAEDQLADLEDELFNKYFISTKKIDPNIRIVKYNSDSDIFESCLDFKECKNTKLTNENILDLLSGRLEIDKKEYQFFGSVDKKSKLLLTK